MAGPPAQDRWCLMAGRGLMGHAHCLGQLFPWGCGINRGLKVRVGQFGLVGSLVAGFSSSICC